MAATEARYTRRAHFQSWLRRPPDAGCGPSPDGVPADGRRLPAAWA